LVDDNKVNSGSGGNAAGEEEGAEKQDHDVEMGEVNGSKFEISSDEESDE